jgi:proline iminopeptidase
MALVSRSGWVALLVSAGCLDPSVSGNLVPPTVVEDPTLPALVVNGARMHAELVGPEQAQVIVVLHGGPGDDFRYMRQLADTFDGYSLADEYRLVFWDQRSAGLSQRFNRAEDLGLDVHLRDLEDLINQTAGRAGKVVLLGHSWGGAYAAMYMNAHPERIAGAILMEPAELSTALGDEIVEAVSLSLTSEWLNDWAWGRQLISLGDHERADYYLALGYLADSQPQRHDARAPVWRFGAAVKFHLYLHELERPFDFTTRLHEVVPSVLFVAGARTEDLGPAFQDKQRKVFTQSKLEVIADAGHNDIVLGRAGESVSLIRDYLHELLP